MRWWLCTPLVNIYNICIRNSSWDICTCPGPASMWWLYYYVADLHAARAHIIGQQYRHWDTTHGPRHNKQAFRWFDTSIGVGAVWHLLALYRYYMYVTQQKTYSHRRKLIISRFEPFIFGLMSSRHLFQFCEAKYPPIISYSHIVQIDSFRVTKTNTYNFDFHSGQMFFGCGVYFYVPSVGCALAQPFLDKTNRLYHPRKHNNIYNWWRIIIVWNRNRKHIAFQAYEKLLPCILMCLIWCEHCCFWLKLFRKDCCAGSIARSHTRTHTHTHIQTQWAIVWCGNPGDSNSTSPSALAMAHC